MVRLLNKMDKTLLALTTIMFLFGLFMILDASSMKSFIVYGVSTKYFTKQLFILILSFVLSLFIITKSTKRYKFYIYPITAAILFLLSFLLVSGVATNNSKSWIYVFGFGLQPSEFAKVAIIVLTGFWYKYNLRRLDKWFYALFPIGVGATYTLFTLLQPDGGTGLIIFFIVVFLFFLSPISKEIKVKTTLAGMGFVIFLLLILLISGKSFFTDMQASRFNFLKPCTRYQ